MNTRRYRYVQIVPLVPFVVRARLIGLEAVVRQMALQRLPMSAAQAVARIVNETA